MTYVLGVDPGVVSGWALVGPSGPIIWGQTGREGKKTTRGTGDDAAAVVGDCAAEVCCPPSEITLAIEGQFLRDGAGRREADRALAVSSLKTARHAGIWIGVCQSMGLPVFEHKGEPAIPANTWRAAVWGGRWSSEQAKTHAVKITTLTWGIRILKTHHHTAEAIWIGEYARGWLVADRQQRSLGL